MKHSFFGKGRVPFILWLVTLGLLATSVASQAQQPSQAKGYLTAEEAQKHADQVRQVLVQLSQYVDGQMKGEVNFSKRLDIAIKAAELGYKNPKVGDWKSAYESALVYLQERNGKVKATLEALEELRLRRLADQGCQLKVLTAKNPKSIEKSFPLSMETIYRLGGFRFEENAEGNIQLLEGESKGGAKGSFEIVFYPSGKKDGRFGILISGYELLEIPAQQKGEKPSYSTVPFKADVSSPNWRGLTVIASGYLNSYIIECQ